MIKRAISLVLILSPLLSSTPALAEKQGIPSNAGSGSYSVNQGELPRADKIYPSRKKIQIVDEGPEVTDTRPPLQAPANYVINVPPRQVAPGATYVIGEPSGGAAGGPIQVPLNSNGLPQAGFTRYFKPGQTAPLPPGQSSGGHVNQTAPVLAGPSQGAQKSVSGTAHVPQPVQANGYAPYNTSSGSSSGGKTGVGTVSGTYKDWKKERLQQK